MNMTTFRTVANRQKAISLVVALSALLLLTHQAPAQSKSTDPETPSLCNREHAIETIRQQLDAAKTIDDRARRIAVLIRAADLLWVLRRDQARAAFTEAFDVAIENEKDQEDEKSRLWKQHRSVLLILNKTADQRYLVIRAVTRRDSVWAKKLTDRVLEIDRRTAAQSTNNDSFRESLTAYRLLDSARQLVSSDLTSALDLARTSLKFPATDSLSRFLYKLADADQHAADQFYSQALSVYANRPMREFLYLATYPFALRSSGDTPIFGFYEGVIPANFTLNNSLQREFTMTLLRRAQQALEVPLDDSDNYNRLSGTGHIWQMLLRIEPHVRERLPDLVDAVVQAREKTFVSLPTEIQEKLGPADQREVPPSPVRTFNERIEKAEKTPNVNERDDLIAEAILDSSAQDNLNSLINAAEKISESNIRDPLVEWIYFRQAQEAVKRKQFDEAERLASKVEGHEQLAFLRAEIAKGLMSTAETQNRAHENLDQAIAEANKAGMTIYAARLLLTASNLYARIDVGRSLSILGDAVNSINHLEAPDFSGDNQTLVREPKRKNNPGGRFIINFYMPGLDPETAFRELAKIDFNDAFTQTSALTDKFHRAMITLAVAEVCLQETDRRRNEKPKKITSQP